MRSFSDTQTQSKPDYDPFVTESGEDSLLLMLYIFEKMW